MSTRLSSFLANLADMFERHRLDGQSVTFDVELSGLMAIGLFEAAERVRALETAERERDELRAAAAELQALDQARRHGDAELVALVDLAAEMRREQIRVEEAEAIRAAVAQGENILAFRTRERPRFARAPSD